MDPEVHEGYFLAGEKGRKLALTLLSENVVVCPWRLSSDFPNTGCKVSPCPSSGTHFGHGGAGSFTIGDSLSSLCGSRVPYSSAVSAGYG
jgi:hypothetical protein